MHNRTRIHPREEGRYNTLIHSATAAQAEEHHYTRGLTDATYSSVLCTGVCACHPKGAFYSLCARTRKHERVDVAGHNVCQELLCAHTARTEEENTIAYTHTRM